MNGRVKGLFLFFAHTTPLVIFYLSSALCVVELIQSAAAENKSPKKRGERKKLERRAEI